MIVALSHNEIKKALEGSFLRMKGERSEGACSQNLNARNQSQITILFSRSHDNQL